MIDNDKEFEEALKKYMKSKGVEMTEADFCEGLSCNDCALKGGASEFVCSRNPFRTIEMYDHHISLLKREINIIDQWERENSSSAKETWEEEEKIYAEIQLLITKNGELTKEIARLYRKLDQMEKGEKKNG